MDKLNADEQPIAYPPAEKAGISWLTMAVLAVIMAGVFGVDRVHAKKVEGARIALEAEKATFVADQDSGMHGIQHALATPVQRH